MIFTVISLEEMNRSFVPNIKTEEDLKNKKFYYVTTFVGTRTMDYREPFADSGFEREYITKICYPGTSFYPNSMSGTRLDLEDFYKLSSAEQEQRIDNFRFKLSSSLNTAAAKASLAYIINGAIMNNDDIFFVFDDRKGIPFPIYAACFSDYTDQVYGFQMGRFDTYLGENRDEFEITGKEAKSVLSKARAELLALEAQAFDSMVSVGEYFYPGLEAIKFALNNSNDLYVDLARELGLDKKYNYNIVRTRMPLNEKLSLIKEEIQAIEDKNYHLLRTTDIDDLDVIDLLWLGSLVGIETKTNKDMAELTRDELLNLLYEAGKLDLEKERYTRPNLLAMDIIKLDKIRQELNIPYSPYNGQIEYNKMIDAILVAKGNKKANFKLPHSSELLKMEMNELYDIYLNEYNGDPVRIKREDIYYIPKDTFVRLLISMERAKMEKEGLMGLTIERLQQLSLRELKLLFRNILRTKLSRENVLPVIYDFTNKDRLIDYVAIEFNLPSEAEDLKNNIPSEDVLKSMLKKDLYNLAVKLRLNVNPYMNKHDILGEIIYFRREIELEKARQIILGEVTIENLMLLSKDKLCRMAREYGLNYRVTQSKISLAKLIYRMYESGKMRKFK